MAQRIESHSFRRQNQSTGRSWQRGCRGRKHTASPARRRIPNRGANQEKSLQDPIKCLALAGANLATLNVRGQLLANGGKLEALILAASQKRLGVVGLQETHELGIVERQVEDFWGEFWSLHIAGPCTAPRSKGTGFLISPQFKVLEFQAISPRVSWILIQRKANGRTNKFPKACFLSVYAPTESNSTEQDITDFYEEIGQALAQAQKELGSRKVPILGDFNINLGNDVEGLGLEPRVIGKALRVGPSSPNSVRLLSFCNENGYSLVQTMGHPNSMGQEANWSTWSHPATGAPHMKDFVLIPRADLIAAKTCRPNNSMGILTDHRMVVLRVNSSACARYHMLTKRVGASGRHKGPAKSSFSSTQAKVRQLDHRQAQKLSERFKVVLERKLGPLQAGWNSTEKALTEAAFEVLPKNRGPRLKSWQTPEALREIKPLLSASSKLRAKIKNTPPADKPALLIEVRSTKRAVKSCVEKHKQIYRRQLAALVMSTKDPLLRKLALQQLARGYNLSKDIRRRPDVPPEKFTDHFEKLFSKVSPSETLGLTEDKVGPKSETLAALSGPPTSAEIEIAIGKLKHDRAPGANGLRAELFKAGGKLLAERLGEDYKAIWPVITGGVCTSNSVKVFQSWQDAEVVTLFKKGSRSDPGNYRGIFLLDVAGKILASVVEKRVKIAAEPWLSDSQNGFRERRSTSHSIHILRRLQEAVRHSDNKAYVVFIDFAKAFDSPPRAAILECLEWIGLPKDLLAIISAIHEDPKGRVSGSDVWFRIARGIRQGCVLGPTLFCILLEFAKRMAGIEDLLGIELSCAKGSDIKLPADLVGKRFRLGSFEYADDMAFISSSAARLSEALDKLQAVCGKIGLEISAPKTEWLYLHNPNNQELNDCANKRTKGQCCEQVLLGGRPLKHVPSFRYLGSVITENGGMEAETRFRCMQAELSLNKYNAIWSSGLTLRHKVRLLKSHVFPSLLYATECGNHTQDELKLIEVFLNKCRRRLLTVGRRRVDGQVITNEELQRMCQLPQPLDIISRRRLLFAAKTITRPSSSMARQMFFAEIAGQRRKIGGRARSSYLNVLKTDLQYLNTGAGGFGSLDSLLTFVHSAGPPRARKALNAIKPDTTKGGSIRLVKARPKEHTCSKEGCRAQFAEKKELNRHIRTKHEPRNSADPTGSGASLPFPCPLCKAAFKTKGWLGRHFKTNHGDQAEFQSQTAPPFIVGPDQGVLVVGHTQRQVNDTANGRVNPVSSPGDGGGRAAVSRRRQRNRRSVEGDLQFVL